MQEKRKLQVVGWCLYDAANSSYTTIIITVAFNVIFAQLIVGPDSGTPDTFTRGNFLWSFVLSISWFLTAMLGPLVGAISDVSGQRKRFLLFSTLSCALGTAALYLVRPGDIFLASILIILTNMAFAFSENFISAFLPHIVEPKDYGKISGIGWGVGYLGGLGAVILCSWIVSFDFKPEHYEELRWVGPLTGGFFLLFSLPTFLWVREPRASTQLPNLWKQAAAGYRDLLATFKALHQFQDLAKFLVSFLFFQAGLMIVISFAALYGQQVVGLSGSLFTLFFVTLQISAALGSFAFGWIQDKIGALRTINITLFIWIFTILAIYFLEDLSQLLFIENTKMLFLGIANVAGICLGATQASSRSVIGLFSPAHCSGQFFGFWGFAGKLSAVLGVLIFGALQVWIRLEAAMLACSLFFVLGLLINAFVNEERGKLQGQAKGVRH